jgi:hypothetical protein
MWILSQGEVGGNADHPHGQLPLYRLMADRIGREYARAQAKQIFRNLLCFARC